MFGSHFYHSITRKTVAVFGTLFNDIKILRRGGSNQVESMSKVPISYGPKQKFLARLDQQPDLEDTTKTALKLPRMSFEMTGMQFDPTTKQSSFNKINVNENTGTTQALIRNGAPYIMDMQLNIMVKNQDDGLQIVEQILPLFQPTYNVSVKYLDGLDLSIDVPITLNNVTFTDDYEGDYLARRVIIYTLDFTIKVRYFPGVETQSVIRQVYNNFIDQNTNAVLEVMQTQTNPTEARKSDSYEVDTAIFFITSALRFELNISGNIAYQTGEYVLGGTTGYTGLVESVTYDATTNTTTLVVIEPEGYFLINEVIGGLTSNVGDALNSYEVVT